MKTVKIGLLGLGTVGGGVYKLIERQKSEMVSKTGADGRLLRFWFTTGIKSVKALMKVC